MRYPIACLMFLTLIALAACADEVTSDASCDPPDQFNLVTGECIREADRPRIDTSPGSNAVPGEPQDPAVAVRLEPSSGVFDYTPARESAEADFTLYNDAAIALTLTAVELDGDAAEFTVLGLAPNLTIAAGESLTFTVRFTPADTRDDRAGVVVHFDHGLTPARLELESRLIGAEVCTQDCPRLQADPAWLTFTYTPGAAAMEQEVALGNVGDTTLTVHQIFIVQPGTEFTLLGPARPFDLRPGANETFTVRFTPGNPLNDTARLKIQSNDPWTPELDIPITANVKVNDQEPCVSVSPTSLNFGTVQRGNVVRRTFAITNCGRTDVTISSIDRGSIFGIPTSRSFQLTDGHLTPFTLAGSASRTVEVTFTPGRAGLYRGNFVVRTNVANNSSIRVNLSATAEAPPLSEQDIHVKLTWNTNNTDVDLHMLEMPGGRLFCPSDCYFSNPEPDWGVPGDWEDNPFLDRDIVSGYGPENINLQRATDGKSYKIVLHYWRDNYQNSFSTASDATVELYIRGQLIQTFGPRRLNATGDTWDVFEIAWPSQQITTFNDPLYRRASQTSCN
jgi:hypothetical protein